MYIFCIIIIINFDALLYFFEKVFTNNEAFILWHSSCGIHLVAFILWHSSVAFIWHSTLGALSSLTVGQRAIGDKKNKIQ